MNRLWRFIERICGMSTVPAKEDEEVLAALKKKQQKLWKIVEWSRYDCQSTRQGGGYKEDEDKMFSLSRVARAFTHEMPVFNS